jgi:uncharacterized protein with ParB-like and HNH nuclease domain
MKAEEKEIQSLIEGQKQYIIPLYQRSYVWEKKHWQTLWDDLKELLYPSDDNKDDNKHFFGSFVTMPLKNNEKIKKFLLIDGQQRLTTILVLLAALRDKAKENDSTEKLAEEIEQQYLFNPYSGNTLKLLPTKLQNDRNCFEQIIRGEKSSVTNRIQECFLFFTKLVSSPKIDIKKLKGIILNTLVIVHIELDHRDDPYKIFESLNAKSAELSQADLIRNHFLMRINDDKQQEDYDTYWKPIQQKLGDNTSEYMRHYLMKDGAMVKKNDVYFTLKKRIDGLKPRTDVIDLLKELNKFAGYYEKLLYPEKETNREIKDSLSRLNKIELTLAYPFLLNIYDDYETQKLSVVQFVEILNVLENFSVRRSICQIPSYRLNKIFPTLYKKSSEQGHLIGGLKKELSKYQYPTDLEFIKAFKTTPLYSSSKSYRARQKTKFILWRLEYFENKEPVDMESKNITIEHIMPQKLTSEWEKSLGKDYLNIHETLVNTIGNLTLSAYNKDLARFNFLKKKKILAKSNLSLNKYFAEVTQWNEEAIRQRADELATFALKIWPYFGSEIPTYSFLSENDSDVKGKKPRKVIIMGESRAVSSWRDVMVFTLDTIIDINVESFDKIIEEFPQYVAWENHFRVPRQLSNDCYIETHINAQSIYKFCCDVIELSGLSSQDWQIQLQIT